MGRMSRLSDVLVVGGGAIGGSVAWSLARRGVAVTIVEAGRGGKGAGWARGGGGRGGSVAGSLGGGGGAVTIVEAGRVGKGASWAAAGVLAPDWSGCDPPALTALAEAGLATWPDWAAEIEGRTGVGLGFR